MDPTRFDALARSFASAGTRRWLLAVLAALPLGGTLLTHDEDDAAAERPHERVKRRTKQHRRKGRNQRRGKKHANNKKKRNNQGGKGGENPGNCTLNGESCQQNSDCCGGNCFGQVCADPVSQCAGTDCPAGATGCCSGTCCAAPTNQCNALGECCAPDCDNKQCGPDGCGNAGTCGKCGNDQTCNRQTGRCDCNPSTCPNGCCDEDGVCQPGNTEQACGDGGVMCTRCGSHQYCSTETGTCRDDPLCSPTTCPNGCCFEQDNGDHVCRTDRRGCTPGGPCCTGCCDENEECQKGDEPGACGAGGSACVTCDPLYGQCDAGRCQCDANNCSGCCLGGPGNPGFCELGNTDQFCGSGGELCMACPTGTTCNGQGACTCLNTNEFCGAGVDCVACPEGTACNTQGECVCTAQSCSGNYRSCQNNQCLCDVVLCPGCCQDGVCMPGDTRQACHTEFEAVCEVCPPGDECVYGGLNVNGCCPSGWNFCGECCPPDQGCCWPGGCCSGQCCNVDPDGFDAVCCPTGVDCCNNACCPTEYPHCADVGNGTMECVF